MALFIFNEYSTLRLLSVAETRFASNIIMAVHLREVKTSLEKMVMDANWKISKEDGNSAAEIKAREVKQCIVDDSWWDSIDYLISFTKPIIDMLRLADTDSSFTSDSSNGVPRISPHEDHEVSMNRSKRLKRLFPNQTDLRKVYVEYGAFSSGSDYFNQLHVIDARMFEEPLS
ncbi:hypothetical protein ACSBR1_029463 [Camellia fascicularis]